MKPSDVLNRGAEILVERGHAKCVYVDGSGRVCATGALYLATGGRFIARSLGTHIEDGDLSLWRVARHYLARTVGVGIVELWNDEHTMYEVLDAFHQAALLAKEEGQ